MPKPNTTAQLESVNGRLAALRTAEEKSLADNAASTAKLLAEREEIGRILAPLHRLLQDRDALVIQRQNVLDKIQESQAGEVRFEAEIRKCLRQVWSNQWLAMLIENNPYESSATRRLEFARREIVVVEAELADLDGRISGYRSAHGIS